MVDFFMIFSMKKAVDEDKTTYFSVLSEDKSVFRPIGRMVTNEDGTYLVESVVPGTFPAKCKSIDEVLRKICYDHNIGNLKKINDNVYIGAVEILAEEKEDQISLYQKFNNKMIFLLGNIDVIEHSFRAKTIFDDRYEHFDTLNNAAEFILGKAGIIMVEDGQDDEDGHDENEVEEDSVFYRMPSKSVH